MPTNCVTDNAVCPLHSLIRGFHCVEKEGLQHQAKLGTFITEARIFFPWLDALTGCPYV